MNGYEVNPLPAVFFYCFEYCGKVYFFYAVFVFCENLVYGHSAEHYAGVGDKGFTYRVHVTCNAEIHNGFSIELFDHFQLFEFHIDISISGRCADVGIDLYLECSSYAVIFAVRVVDVCRDYNLA